MIWLLLGVGVVLALTLKGDAPAADNDASSHFAWREFQGPDPIIDAPYPVAWRTDKTRGVKLISLLEKIRALPKVSRPVSITPNGGYRTAERQRIQNPKVPEGQHTKGRAADLRARGLSADELYAAILEARNAGKLPELGGLGIYDSFVHVDVRENKMLAEWDNRTAAGKAGLA